MKQTRVWIGILLGVCLVAILYLASGLGQAGTDNKKETGYLDWDAPLIKSTPVPSLDATGWWSSPPTPQTMKTWELTPTLTQTIKP